jgi:hypothetical protein
VTDSASRASAGASSRRRLSALTTLLLVLLQVQFLLGMAVNLFVKIPDSHPGAKPSGYFTGAAQSVAWAATQGSLWLQLHAIFGLLLVLLALLLLTLALRSQRRSWIVACVFGLVGVLGGGFNGASFLNYHEDFSSLLMATGLAVATAAYVLGLRAAYDEGLR